MSEQRQLIYQTETQQSGSNIAQIHSPPIHDQATQPLSPNR